MRLVIYDTNARTPTISAPVIISTVAVGDTRPAISNDPENTIEQRDDGIYSPGAVLTRSEW